jgi:hypothetical protein
MLTPRHDVYRVYWNLAAERQRIFFKRQAGIPAPWTVDPILAHYKFCNAYRASDRVSQYLIRHVIYTGDLTDVDILLRTVMFRLFSKPSTWESLEQEVGRVTADSFEAEQYGATLEALRKNGPIYTNAFILCANKAYGHDRKHKNHMALLSEMFENHRFPQEVAACANLKELYEILRSYPLLGDFMAYQIATDINYSEVVNFEDNAFTVAGPGARRGLQKVFESREISDAETILWMTNHQEEEFERLGIDFPDLFGHRLQAIDCQNLFCETDKYSRVAFPALTSNRTRIKQAFTPNAKPLPLFYPPKWGINDQL